MKKKNKSDESKLNVTGNDPNVTDSQDNKTEDKREKVDNPNELTKDEKETVNVLSKITGDTFKNITALPKTKLFATVEGNTVIFEWTLPQNPKWTFIKMSTDNFKTEENSITKERILQQQFSPNYIKRKEMFFASGSNYHFKIAGFDAKDNEYESNVVHVKIK